MTYVRAIRSGEDRFSFKTFWNYVILDREQQLSGAEAEYTNLVVDDPEELDDVELKAKDIEEESIPVRHARIVEPIRTDLDMHEQDDHDDTAQWANDVRRHRRHVSYPHSAASERTLFGAHSPHRSDESLHENEYVYPWQGKDKREVLRFIGRATFAVCERILVFAGFMQVTSGIVVYTGACRGGLINSCLAHLISEYSGIAFAHVLTKTCRGRHLLVLRARHVRTVPGFLLGARLGLEPRASSPREVPHGRVCRVARHLPLRYHEHLDGAVRRKPW